jgi:hypothetical protein
MLVVTESATARRAGGSEPPSFRVLLIETETRAGVLVAAVNRVLLTPRAP